MTIVEKIYNMYLQNPNKVAIITEDKEINYNDFWINICKYASAINKYNLNDEDIIIFENTQDERFCYTLLAINLLGYIALPVDKNIPKKTINHLMKSVNAKKLIMKDEIIITEEMFMPKYFPLDDKICNILLSSGSTGDEKKIKYYHKTISNMISSFYDTYNLNDNNMIMITGPLSHAYSFVSMYIAFNYNLPFYIYNSLNIIDFISILEKEYEHIIVFTNPTFLHYLINLFYEDIKNIINKIDIINSATAPLNNKDVEKLLTIYDHKIYNHYGSTEGFSLSCIDLSKYEYKNGLVGIPMNNTMIEIVNEKNEEVILVNNNKGYWYNDGITGSIYIKEKYFQKLLKNNKLKYFGFCERFFGGNGFRNESALQIELFLDNTEKYYRHYTSKRRPRSSIEKYCLKCPFYKEELKRQEKWKNTRIDWIIDDLPNKEEIDSEEKVESNKM